MSVGAAFLSLADKILGLQPSQAPAVQIDEGAWMEFVEQRDIDENTADALAARNARLDRARLQSNGAAARERRLAHNRAARHARRGGPV
jgi:hypothetical protein